MGEAATVLSFAHVVRHQGAPVHARLLAAGTQDDGRVVLNAAVRLRRLRHLLQRLTFFRPCTLVLALNGRCVRLQFRVKRHQFDGRLSLLHGLLRVLRAFQLTLPRLLQ